MQIDPRQTRRCQRATPRSPGRRHRRRRLHGRRMTSATGWLCPSASRPSRADVSARMVRHPNRWACCRSGRTGTGATASTPRPPRHALRFIRRAAHLGFSIRNRHPCWPVARQGRAPAARSKASPRRTSTTWPPHRRHAGHAAHAAVAGAVLPRRRPARLPHPGRPGGGGRWPAKCRPAGKRSITGSYQGLSIGRIAKTKNGGHQALVTTLARLCGSWPPGRAAYRPPRHPRTASQCTAVRSARRVLSPPGWYQRPIQLKAPAITKRSSWVAGLSGPSCTLGHQAPESEVDLDFMRRSSERLGSGTSSPDADQAHAKGCMTMSAYACMQARNWSTALPPARREAPTPTSSVISSPGARTATGSRPCSSRSSTAWACSRCRRAAMSSSEVA